MPNVTNCDRNILWALGIGSFVPFTMRRRRPIHNDISFVAGVTSIFFRPCYFIALFSNEVPNVMNCARKINRAFI